MTDACGRSGRFRFQRGRRRPLPILLLAMAAAGGAARLEAAIGASLEASPSSPAPVGTMIHWTAQVTGGSGDFWYRFRVREPGGGVRMIRDLGPISTLDWTSLEEGVYELELTVRDRISLELETVTSSFELVSRVGSAPAVSPTSHPLVFLFSSPGCDAGLARARFESEGVVQYTPYRPCAPGRSLNFYLAGLRPNATCRASLVVERGRVPTEGPAVTFATGDVSYGFPLPAVVQSAPAPGPERILLQSPLFLPPLATDLDGNLVWIGPPDLFILTRPDAGGTFFGIADSKTDPARDIVRKFDLVGMTVLETNAARVSEQLVAMGKRPITGFHHEARPIRGGRTVVLAGVEQILTGVQGPAPVDVLGDMVVVLDADMQVVWAWDSFDHLDASRRALLGQTCKVDPGCAPYYLAADANDWTHGNSVDEAPDGALLVSLRHQDWVLKIDYDDGAGNGDVIWRLGRDGDFTFDSADPYPWFSHQHDVSYVPGRRSTISLFDNGNVRETQNPGASSRGQVLELDETNRIARLAMNADLGVFSLALGSAQRLSDGHYHFDAGFVFDPQSVFGGVAYSVELASPSEVLSSIKLGAPVYRSFRVADLYGETASAERPRPRVVNFRN
ncbi:MAG: aryl-sulfate sulfotransferase [Acidobacteriota bacterium]